MDWAQTINAAASGLLALCCLVFVVTYHVQAPWWSTPVGRHLMVFTAALGLLSGYTVAITVWDTGIPAAVLRTARTLVILGMAGLVIQRIRMVVTAQRRSADRSERDRSGPRPG